MASQEYQRLQQQDSDLEEKVPLPSIFEQSRLQSRIVYISCILLLLISLSCNATLLYRQLEGQSKSTLQAPSKYAGLMKNMAVPFTIDTSYTSSNRTIEDKAWKSPKLNSQIGLVAVSDTWAHSKRLPKAQRFPWNDTKGIYLLNGYHNIHCLHILRRSIVEAYDGKTQSLYRHHVTHCLNVLREDIVCNADDTPRYTGRLNEQVLAEHPTSGVGQIRNCRDWNQLEQWAVEKSACYKAINASDPDFPPIERYKFCPNGERLWP